MANKSMKRRQYYIDKRFQTRFILKFFLILVVGAVLSVAITWWTTDATLTSTFDGAKLAIKKTSIVILPSVVFTNIITTAFLGLIVVVFTLLASHKIAGPMYRFEKDLEDIAAGNLQKKIHIRSGDQFSGMANNLNDMVRSLNGKLREVRVELDQLVTDARERQFPTDFIEELEACKNKFGDKFQL